MVRVLKPPWILIPSLENDMFNSSINISVLEYFSGPYGLMGQNSKQRKIKWSY